jgi:hypothetical protein
MEQLRSVQSSKNIVVDNEFDRLVEKSCQLQIAITEPQLRLLLDLCVAGRPVFTHRYYAPAKGLVKAGLAEWVGYRLRITTAGTELFARIKAQ